MKCRRYTRFVINLFSHLWRFINFILLNSVETFIFPLIFASLWFPPLRLHVSPSSVLILRPRGTPPHCIVQLRGPGLGKQRLQSPGDLFRECDRLTACPTGVGGSDSGPLPLSVLTVQPLTPAAGPAVAPSHFCAAKDTALETLRSDTNIRASVSRQ